MKKKLTFIVAMCATLSAAAQNLQLHYDFGRNIYSDEEAGRPKVTATFEQFKADATGSWFYFIDLDLNRKGVVGAYGELSREFKIASDSPWAAHVEYDGGLSSTGGVFQPAALIGGAWNGHNADYSTTYSAQLMYKQYFKGYTNRAYSSVQLTGVWATTLADGALTFSGFIDIWRGEKAANGHGEMVVLTEPQLWYNVNKSISVGTEVEISNNFVFNMASSKRFFVNPTLGVKISL